MPGKYTKFDDIPQYTRFASYKVDHAWGWLLGALERYEADYKFDYGESGFQRAHVWTENQQRAYVEHVLRGGLGAMDIYTNVRGWNKRNAGEMVLVDGKQRLRAVLRFLKNELTIFDGSLYSDFTDKMPFTARFHWHVNDLDTHAEVLQWYIDLNRGGVAHTDEEIEKVKELLTKEPPPAPKKKGKKS